MDDKENRCDFDRPYYERGRFVCATCYPVNDKESGWCGILMVIHSPKMMNVGKIAHEASHISDYLSDVLGIECYSFANGEPRAYFIEWCANCIDSVMKGKVK